MDYLSSVKDEETGACVSTIEVAVAGRGIKVREGYEKPSAGDVNTCSVSLAIEGGGVWDTLPKKRVTFSTSTASVTVDYAPTIPIPHEVMASTGALYLTLTGYDAGGIEVARTHRMTCPIEVARAGADEGANPTPPTLDVVSRIDALAADLEEKRDTDYWRGPQGIQGVPGPRGPAGPQGPKGDFVKATKDADGLMSASDKKKLDGVAEGANKYVHPTIESGAKAAGLYKFSTDAQGHVTSAAAVTKEDISTLESDPTVPTWAKQPLKPDYDFSEIKNATPISIDYINSL